MAKGIKRMLVKVRKVVAGDISGFAQRGGLYAQGMAGEGYNGGYRDALDDVLLALNGVEPNRGFWERARWTEETKGQTDGQPGEGQ